MNILLVEVLYVETWALMVPHEAGPECCIYMGAVWKCVARCWDTDTSLSCREVYPYWNSTLEGSLHSMYFSISILWCVCLTYAVLEIISQSCIVIMGDEDMSFTNSSFLSQS